MTDNIIIFENETRDDVFAELVILEDVRDCNIIITKPIEEKLTIQGLEEELMMATMEKMEVELRITTITAKIDEIKTALNIKDDLNIVIDK